MVKVAPSVLAEACTHLDRTLDFIKEANIKCGVALNPHTPIDALKHVIHKIDLVLVMTVNPRFILNCLPSIRKKFINHTQTLD